MNANRISLTICAVIASAIAACSGDTSLPTEPGKALNREAPFYGPSAAADGSQDAGTGNTGGQPGSGQGGVTPVPSAGDNPNPNPAPPPGGSQTVQRPIEDFLRTQGTFCVDDGMSGCRRFMGGGANYLSWFDQSRGATIAIDYAGLASAWVTQSGGNPIGSRYFGSISEEPLPSGAVRVTVRLDGTDVLAFAKQGPDLFASGMYGFDTKEVHDPMNTPALGNVQMEIVFINTVPGAPLPDLVQLIRSPGAQQKLLSIRLNYAGSGTMRAASGMGEGTAAKLFVTFDGSQGTIMPSNPAAGGTSAPTGYVTAQFEPTPAS